MKKAVVAIVSTVSKAETMAARLQGAGFRPSDVSVLMPDVEGTRAFAHEHNTKAPEGAVAGVGAGGLVGGTLGLLAGIGALAIPGLGPFIAAGPIMAALSGLAAGATVGGFAGALVGLGIPEYEAKMYEGKLKNGHILVSVHTENRGEQKLAIELFKACGADDVSSQDEVAVPARERVTTT